MHFTIERSSNIDESFIYGFVYPYKHSLTMSLHVPGLICPCTGPGVIFSASIVINVSPSSPVSLGLNRKHLKISQCTDKTSAVAVLYLTGTILTFLVLSRNAALSSVVNQESLSFQLNSALIIMSQRTPSSRREGGQKRAI